MSSEITVQQQFDPQQIEVMRRTVAKDLNGDEFGFFLEVCRGRGLNPFNREIYRLKRGPNAPVQIQVSIDGLRLIAERSGQYRGQLGPYFCGTDGKWREEWLESAPPVAAKVGVLREGFDQPIWAVARYAAYVGRTKDGKVTEIWSKMPDLMCAKCAESLALRKAFPSEMGGLYTHEEMDQASDKSAPPAAVVEARPHNPNSERLNAMYERGLAAGNWSTRSQFLDVMSRVLEQPITRANLHEVNSSMIDLVEEAMLEPSAF